MSVGYGGRLTQPAIQRAVGELEGLIRATFPAAAFAVAEGDDPEGVYVQATVDVDDLTTVLETVAERLFVYQVEQELPIYVIPRRPLGRALADAQRRGSRPHRLSLDEVYSRP